MKLNISTDDALDVLSDIFGEDELLTLRQVLKSPVSGKSSPNRTPKPQEASAKPLSLSDEKKKHLRNQRERARRAVENQEKKQALIDDANLKLDKCFGHTISDRLAWQIIEATNLQNRSILIALACRMVSEIEKPTTVRGVMYRLAGAGIYPGTHERYYRQTLKWCLELRRKRLLSYEWIVDNIRQTRKPPSWSGLSDFLEYAKDTYRLDFWTQQSHYVCVICEANASAGTLMPVIAEFDVALHPLGGEPSDTFVYEISKLWTQISKPIYVYYFGDLNPRGIHIEEKTRQRLEKMSGREVYWKRLGVSYRQAVDRDLPQMPLKYSENKIVLNEYLGRYSDWGCELEALPSTDLRQMLKESIESHIDMKRWRDLKAVEANERNLLDLVEEQAGQLTNTQLGDISYVDFQ